MRRILRNLLEQIGFKHIDEASDGGTALVKLRDSPCGLVISDWNMEPMSGMELLREVRTDEKLKHTPLHHGHCGEQVRECSGSEGSGRQQLHRKTFHCRNAENENRCRFWRITLCQLTWSIKTILFADPPERLSGACP
jgi:Response regulator receiver domain